MSITDILQLTPRTLEKLHSEEEEDSFTIEAREVFDLFDKDGDGSIPTQEIGTAIRALGYYPREAEMVLMEDVAEEINFDQFLQLIKREKLHGLEDKETIVAAFMTICPQTDGKLNYSDFEAILKRKTGEELQQDEISIIQKSLNSIKQRDNTMAMDDFLTQLLNGLGFGEKKSDDQKNGEGDNESDISQFSFDSYQ